MSIPSETPESFFNRLEKTNVNTTPSDTYPKYIVYQLPKQDNTLLIFALALVTIAVCFTLGVVALSRR